jgi:hypothetical protein
MAEDTSSERRSSARWQRRAREVLTALILTLLAVAFVISTLPL